MSLQILRKQSVCRPGALLKWVVAWEFDLVPTSLTIEISWRTSGKGTEDSETVFSEQWSPGSAVGERSFEYALPRGPISVRGNLFSIDWQIACKSNGPDESEVMPFVLSHLDQPVRLEQVSDGLKSVG